MSNDTTEKPTPQQVLDLELPDNDSGESTVRGYLIKLLAGVWEHGEGFNGKRPFGNSGWHGDFDKAFIEAGWVDGRLINDGDDKWVDVVDSGQVDALVRSAIKALAARPVEAVLVADEPKTDFTRHDRQLALNQAVIYHAEVGVDDDEHVVRTAAEMAAFLADGTVPAAEADEPSKPKIEVRRPDDEHVEVWVAGVQVASGNHDELGWSGMDALVAAARGVAQAFDVEVESTGPGDA